MAGKYGVKLEDLLVMSSCPNEKPAWQSLSNKQIPGEQYKKINDSTYKYADKELIRLVVNNPEIIIYTNLPEQRIEQILGEVLNPRWIPDLSSRIHSCYDKLDQFPLKEAFNQLKKEGVKTIISSNPPDIHGAKMAGLETIYVGPKNTILPKETGVMSRKTLRNLLSKTQEQSDYSEVYLN